MSKKSTYTTPGGKVIKDAKPFYFYRTLKDGSQKMQYMMKGIAADTGNVSTSFVSKETAESYGKPAKNVKSANAVVRQKKKNCDQKYDECVAKKAAKRAAKKAAKKSPKKSPAKKATKKKAAKK